jgi:hypothetical protein
VIINAMKHTGVRATPRRFTNKRCALQHLEVVAELLGSRQRRA